MDEQTPNIHVVQSVWRRLKKAKFRDLEPKKEVKGGGAGTDTPKPATDNTKNRGNR